MGMMAALGAAALGMATGAAALPVAVGGFWMSTALLS